MNVTIIANKLDLEGGGSNFSLHLLASSLYSSGHNVKVTTINTSESNSVDEEIDYDLIQWVDSRNFSHIKKFKQIIECMRNHEEWTDVYHIFAPPYIAPAGIFARSSDVPIVARLNTYTFFCPNMAKMDGKCHENCTILKKATHDDNKLSEKIGKLPQYVFQTKIQPSIVNNIDKFFALSPNIKEIYCENGLDSSKVRVIPNCYNPSFSPNSLNRTFPSESFDILYVGRLVREKGVDVLIKAIPQIISQNPSTLFNIHIVGDGRMKDELVELSKRKGVEEHVDFHGRVDHSLLSEYYENADLFVHPGRWPEPFGRTLLEAMQYQLPSVVSNVGAPQWVIGETGLTFQRESSEDLARMVSRLANDKGAYMHFVKNTTDQLEEFSKTSIIDNVIEEYKKLC